MSTQGESRRKREREKVRERLFMREEASFAWLKNHLSSSNIATRDASSALLEREREREREHRQKERRQVKLTCNRIL